MLPERPDRGGREVPAGDDLLPERLEERLGGGEAREQRVDRVSPLHDVERRVNLQNRRGGLRIVVRRKRPDRGAAHRRVLEKSEKDRRESRVFGAKERLE